MMLKKSFECTQRMSCNFLVRYFFIVLGIILFGLSFTPYNQPTFFVAFAPLVWIWRHPPLVQSQLLFSLEAIAIGFAMAWSITGFVAPAVPPWGIILQASSCLVCSLSIVAIANASRFSRSWNILTAAPFVAFIATIADLLQAWLGLTWSATNLSLAIAPTPIAQWSGLVSTFGLTYAVVLINVLWLPDLSKSHVRRWTTTIFAFVLSACLFLGGMIIESRVDVKPIPFSAILVQPNFSSADFTSASPSLWKTLHTLTLSSLESDGPVDLIVWPETCLAETAYKTIQKLEEQVESVAAHEEPLGTVNLDTFQKELHQKYDANCLLGVCMMDEVSTLRFGIEVSEWQRFNCACLVSKDKPIDFHEKTILVPLREGLPRWMQFDFVRLRILPFFGLQASLCPGRNFHLLKFLDSQGAKFTVAPVVCYESWHPWLPQFHQRPSADVTVYLLYDGDFFTHPELIERQLLSIRLRSIETRTWGLVCSTWRGSAIIDPRGRTVKELP